MLHREALTAKSERFIVDMLRVHYIWIVAVVCACQGTPDSSTLDGNPALAFERLTPMPTGEHPNTLVIYDFDGDGDDDIFVPGLVDSAMTFLRNEGQRRFTRLSGHQLPSGALDCVHADIEPGNAGHEVACTLPAVDSIIVFSVRPDFSFDILREIPFLEPGYLATADLDQDGALDIVVTRFRDGALVPLFRDGAEFTLGTPALAGAGAERVIAVDLLETGAPQLAVVASIADEITIFEPTVLRQLEKIASAATAAWPVSLVPVDLDGNGNIELYGATNLGNTLFSAHLDRTSPPSLSIREQPAREGAMGVAVSDLDGDGYDDVVVTNKFVDSVSIHRNDQHGQLKEVVVLATGGGPTVIATPDLDNDGLPDLVIVNGFSNDVEVWFATP